MTDSTPELTLIETVAHRAAEAAVAAFLPRLEALERAATTTPPAPVPIALPDDLESRLAALERGIRLALESEPAPAPLSDEDRKIIEDLRLSNAHNTREIKLLKETP